MKKASKELITFYKAFVVDPIYKKQAKDGAGVTKEQIDTLIKDLVDIDMSCIEMSEDELYEVIYKGFELGDAIGLELGFPSDLEHLNKRK